tara:strand:- start:549 stop:1145 length:597 start_codon:yes stop_codon:yes gene_type:complete
MANQVEDKLANKWVDDDRQTLLEMATGYKTSKELPQFTDILSKMSKGQKRWLDEEVVSGVSRGMLAGMAAGVVGRSPFKTIKSAETFMKLLGSFLGKKGFPVAGESGKFIIENVLKRVSARTGVPVKKLGRMAEQKVAKHGGVKEKKRVFSKDVSMYRTRPINILGEHKDVFIIHDVKKAIKHDDLFKFYVDELNRGL